MTEHFNDANFATAIENGVTLVDFWASWCGPCRMVAPVIEQLAADFDGRARVGKVDVDEQADLAGRYGIQSIPTVMLFKDGNLEKTLIGVQDYDTYALALNAIL